MKGKRTYTDGTYKHSQVTNEILAAFYEVYNALGYGFLEKVYERALSIEIGRRGLEVKPQHPIHVYYRDELVGEYYADLLVEDKVLS